MADKKSAWLELQATAKAYALEPTSPRGQALAEAACEWAKAKGYREPRAASEESSSDAVLPGFGRQKGQPISGAESRDLEWYRQALQKSIDDPSKARWIEQNQTVLDAIEAELARRN